MKKIVLQLETLTCPSCLVKIEKGVKKLEGIDNASVEVLFNASKVKLDFDDTIINAESIKESIQSLGYDVLKINIK